MSTDAENTRVVLDAAERIEAIIQSRNLQRQEIVEEIRRDMFRAVADEYWYFDGLYRHSHNGVPVIHIKRPWWTRLADWLNGR